jgi:hypothetical protein
MEICWLSDYDAIAKWLVQRGNSSNSFSSNENWYVQNFSSLQVTRERERQKIKSQSEWNFIVYIINDML